jgi:hypothetical protein
METITFELDQALDLALFTIHKTATYTELRNAILGYYNGKLTKYTVWDFSGSNLAKYVTGVEARELALLVTKLGKARPGGFDLIVVSDMLQYGVARMYTAYADITRHESSVLKALMFRSKELALNWLRDNESKTAKPPDITQGGEK